MKNAVSPRPELPAFELLNQPRSGFQLNRTYVSLGNALVESFRRAGAVVETYPDEGLCSVRMNFDSPAWKIYANWAKSFVGDALPIVQVIRNAPPNDGEKCYHIQMEVRRIIWTLAPKHLDEFANGIEVHPTVDHPPLLLVYMRFAQVAVGILPEAIMLPGPQFPTIHALPAGSYICHLMYSWYDSMIIVPIYKAPVVIIDLTQEE